MSLSLQDLAALGRQVIAEREREAAKEAAAEKADKEAKALAHWEALLVAARAELGDNLDLFGARPPADFDANSYFTLLMLEARGLAPIALAYSFSGVLGTKPPHWLPNTTHQKFSTWQRFGVGVFRRDFDGDDDCIVLESPKFWPAYETLAEAVAMAQQAEESRLRLVAEVEEVRSRREESRAVHAERPRQPTPSEELVNALQRFILNVVPQEE